MTEDKRKIWKDFWAAFAKPIFLGLAALVIIGFVAWHFCTRAVSVNGATISRLTVIQELENESGEAMLDALVTKKLIAQKATEAGIKIDEAEIDSTLKKLEERIAAQGSTLSVALSQQGITMEKFREQITLQKALEKLLADKVAVSDEEVKTYITTSKIATPQGTSEADFQTQVKEQLVSQKLGTAAQEWIAEQKKNSTIEYFVPYAPDPVTEEPLPTSSEAPAPAGEATPGPTETK